MKKNMNTADRLIRLLVSIVFIALYWAGIVPGVLGITLIAISVIFLLTSLVSFCPIYAAFGWRTNKAS